MNQLYTMIIHVFSKHTVPHIMLTFYKPNVFTKILQIIISNESS